MFRNTIVKIKDNETGEISEVADKINFDEENNPMTFIWEEGNYACDCNRRIFFYLGKGEEIDSSLSECGDSRYSVNIIHNGETIYSEFSEYEHG